jgi:hypothetical protein
VNEEEKNARRRMFASIIPYLVSTYLETSKHLDPASIAARVLTEYREEGRRMRKEEDSLRSMLRDIEELDVVVQNGKFSFRLDRPTTLELVGLYLRRMFAKEGATGSLRILPPESSEDCAFDAELRLAERSIFAKIVLDDLTSERLSRCLEKAKLSNPSEFWLFDLKGEDADIRLGPVFVGENRVLSGRFRCLSLLTVFQKLLNSSHSISVEKDGLGVRVLLSMPSSP